VTLVCVPGTEISRPKLSRNRYEAVPANASQANDALHDVLPVERKFSGPGGGFLDPDLASAGASRVSGLVTSRHPPATTRIDVARADDVVIHLAIARIEPLGAEK
jgi:hypothetical protein